MITFLRRMNKTIILFEINSTGQRREEHPTGFKSIHVEITIKSPDVTEDDIKKVISLAEEKYCPVWSMIKGNTIVETSYIINQ